MVDIIDELAPLELQKTKKGTATATASLTIQSLLAKALDGSSIVHPSVVGTVQGSILGPILYAIFVSPLFDLAKMTLFADDNYLLC